MLVFLSIVDVVEIDSSEQDTMRQAKILLRNVFIDGKRAAFHEAGVAGVADKKAGSHLRI